MRPPPVNNGCSRPMDKTITNPIECDALLFDLDGVLIDSTSCIVRHWRAWADQHGLDLDKIMQNAHGMRTIETMQAVAPHLDAEKEAARFNAQEVVDTEGVVAIEGANQVLSTLPDGAWGIVTSGSRELVRARLKTTGLPIPKILVTGDDVKRGKPDPEPYLVGAERFGVAAERCAVIEDAPAGVEAGKKAGMRVIGVASTHTREELLEKGAEMVVDKLMQLDIRKSVDGNELVIQTE
jgi:sugar-phosphatase